jgi:hypothetical protein
MRPVKIIGSAQVSQIGRLGSGKSNPNSFIAGLLIPNVKIAAEPNEQQPLCRGREVQLPAAAAA